MFDTLYSITITQAAAALRAGELTSAALVRHALEAVRLHDGTLNAMLRVSASALEEAERCDAEAAQGSFRGPLHGIPLVIKDNIDVRGLPTTVAAPPRGKAISPASTPEPQASIPWGQWPVPPGT